MPSKSKKQKKNRFSKPKTSRGVQANPQMKKPQASSALNKEFMPWSTYDPNAPLLSMAMMVKNEEEFLEDA